mmetsp:Transcript_9848/g.16210  ORF Transcript_9848/g.16210 Transcript_9848/m.16210 type:complete len:549 (-) Transcript_9848:382-2028(-)
MSLLAFSIISVPASVGSSALFSRNTLLRTRVRNELSTNSRKKRFHVRKSIRRFSNLQPYVIECRVQDAPVLSKSSGSRKVALIALGCPKNTVDAEVMLGDLVSRGFEIVGEAEEADCIIVNTCAFVEDAKAESVEHILEAANLKKNGTVRGIVVTGCLAQRYSSELALELPEVDSVVGFAHYNTLPDTVEMILSRTTEHNNTRKGQAPATAVMPMVSVGEATVPFRAEWDRKRLTPKHYAYLRVAEGCDHACSFCSIPSFRGKFRSKGWDEIMNEARRLVDSGVRELNLIAEDTNQYGMDFGPKDKRRLADLLYALAEIDGLKWIRILYAYPSYFSEELVAAIRDIPSVVKYIDMPLQHISDPVLRAMNRPPYESTYALLERLRREIPDLALRTTFISGFPGETEEDHRRLVDFVRDFKFERGGVFSYSEEEGTSAFLLKDLMIPDEVRFARRDELMSVLQEISFQKARETVGRTLRIMLDEILYDVSGRPRSGIGRTVADAPDIDCGVEVSQLPDDAREGDVVMAKVSGAIDSDLLAECVSNNVYAS